MPPKRKADSLEVFDKKESVISQLNKAIEYAKKGANKFNLEFQQGIVGKILRHPIPLQSSNDNPEFLFSSSDIVGDHHISALLHLEHCQAEIPENRAVLSFAQASGSGKTKLPYSMCFNNLCWPIFVQIVATQNVLSDSANLLVRELTKLKSTEISLTLTQRYERNELYLRMVQVWVLAHVHACIDIFDKLKDEERRNELFLRAQVSAVFQSAVLKYMRFEVAYKEQEFDLYLHEIYQLAESTWTSWVIVYDEVVALHRHLQGQFLSPEQESKRAVTIAVSGSQVLTDSVENKTNLFDALRRCVVRFLSYHKGIRQMFIDTHFSVWDRFSLPRSCAVQSEVRPAWQLCFFTHEMILTTFAKYFDIVLTSKLKTELKSFVGRPIFFFNYFMKEFWQLLRLTSHGSEVKYEDLAVRACKRAFNTATSVFSVIDKDPTSKRGALLRRLQNEASQNNNQCFIGFQERRDLARIGLARVNGLCWKHSPINLQEERIPFEALKLAFASKI